MKAHYYTANSMDGFNAAGDADRAAIRQSLSDLEQRIALRLEALRSSRSL